MDRLQLLKSISFGARVAEEETNELESYFVETDQWCNCYFGTGQKAEVPPQTWAKSSRPTSRVRAAAVPVFSPSPVKGYHRYAPKCEKYRKTLERVKRSGSKLWFHFST
jgi:hypothetical protein